MRDQVIGIYVFPLLLQVLVPLALLAWQAFGSDGSRAEWLIKTLSVAAYLVAVVIAGLWLMAPWYAGVFYLLILVTLIALSITRIRPIPLWPQQSRGWVGIGVRGILAICFVLLVITGLGGREPAQEEIVDLAFPLRNGTYFVVAGGSNELLNPHVGTLTAERFHSYRGESYGIDIVAVNALGMRARGIAPHDPKKYVIFGAAVYAPCSGIVLRAEDGFPDMPPPQPDRDHLTGNYVFLECAGHHILLAHFERGTVRVRPGDSVWVGAFLGQVGNSGNTGEPHLHIHAQRPSHDAAFLSGDPLPVRFDGRFLARNDWVRQSVGLLAPPIGGLVALLAVFILGLVYQFPMRGLFRRWGATEEELKRSMAADGEVANPDYKTTLAVDIDAPPAAVWPWLVQMGYRRGGLYSYDWLDRLFGYLDRPSAERILPEFQQLAVGDVIPVGAGRGFPVKAIKAGKMLLLGEQVEDLHWAWQFELAAIDGDHTRLISRNCLRVPRSWKSVLMIRLIEPGAFIMTRKMLLGIKHRAEGLVVQNNRPKRAS